MNKIEALAAMIKSGATITPVSAKPRFKISAGYALSRAMEFNGKFYTRVSKTELEALKKLGVIRYVGKKMDDRGFVVSPAHYSA